MGVPIACLWNPSIVSTPLPELIAVMYIQSIVLIRKPMNCPTRVLSRRHGSWTTAGTTILPRMMSYMKD